MVCVGLFVVGCASSKPPQSTVVPSTEGLTCTKCQVTWIKVPMSHKNPIIGYTWAKRDVCPDCSDAVQSFFATGNFRHTCKACGDSMEICEAH